MRLSELVSHLTPSAFAQLALVIFFTVFAVVAYRAFRRGARAQSEQWAQLPLSDDANATTNAPSAQGRAS